MNSKQTSEAEGDLNYILSRYLLNNIHLSKNDSETLKKIVYIK
jgi:hypothetical protein